MSSAAFAGLEKSPDAFRTISEVADEIDIPQHVLRFWESRFAQIKPMKRSGGRRYYRPDDVNLLRGIRRLLYGEGYTIRGVQRILREHGIKAVQSLTDAAPEQATALFDGPSFDPQDGSAAKLDLERAMARLAPAESAALTLCYALGHSHGEAAEILNLPLGTVKSHVLRGREKLQAMLETTT